MMLSRARFLSSASAMYQGANAGLYVRLLGVVLPLTIGLGTVLALALAGTSICLALLVGAALAPTDAALGAGMMANPLIPARVRRLINVESGLNDGIATPFVSVALAGAATGGQVAGHGPATAVAQLAAVSLLVWLAFGAVAVVPAMKILTWQMVLYAILRLTVIRMAPVVIALTGARLDRATIMLVAWFGPRGLASVVFALLALEELGSPAAGRAVAVITITVLLSVVAHGATAEPLAARYVKSPASPSGGRGAAQMPDMPDRRLIRRTSSRSCAVPVHPLEGKYRGRVESPAGHDEAMGLVVLPTEVRDRLTSAELTYQEVGATAGVLPAGYHQLIRSVPIGHGRQVFARAGDAVRRWQVQLGAGLQVSASALTAVAGAVVILGIGVGSLRLQAPCRVVYVVNEPRRRGFAYGTLPGHPESGEEAFVIEHHGDDTVSFKITAFSRPATGLAKIAGPLGTVAQRRITARYLRSLGKITMPLVTMKRLLWAIVGTVDGHQDLLVVGDHHPQGVLAPGTGEMASGAERVPGGDDLAVRFREDPQPVDRGTDRRGCAPLRGRLFASRRRSATGSDRQDDPPPARWARSYRPSSGSRRSRWAGVLTLLAFGFSAGARCP